MMTNARPSPAAWTPPSPWPAGVSAPAPLRRLIDGPVSGTGIITALSLFIMLSRFPELLANAVGSSFKTGLVSLILAAGAFLWAGGPFHLMSYGPVRAMILFTLWFIATIPFSEWKGGSVALFKDQWTIALMLFFATAAAPRRWRDVKLVGGALACTSMLILFMHWRYSVFSVNRTTLDMVSTLANPNILCMHLLLSAPFLGYWIQSKGLLSLRGLAGAATLVAIAAVILLDSGSRSGVLAMLFMFVFVFFSLTVKMRLVLSVSVGLLVLLMLPAIPDRVWARYATMFGGGDEYDMSSVEAKESANARWRHLTESLEFTLRNPLVGVGPGQFIVAQADRAKEKNERAAWRETHNTYTQVSCEMGIPGFIFFTWMVVSSFRLLMKVRAGVPEMRQFAGATLAMGVGLVVTSNFSSSAYGYYWPAFAGLAVALHRIGSQTALVPAAAAPAVPSVPAGPGRAGQRMVPQIR